MKFTKYKAPKAYIEMESSVSLKRADVILFHKKHLTGKLRSIGCRKLVNVHSAR